MQEIRSAHDPDDTPTVIVIGVGVITSATLRTMGADILVRRLSLAHEEFDPTSPFALRPGLGPTQEVAFGNHADQRALAIHDRQAADAILQQGSIPE